MKTFWDVIVVGAGPAGLACACTAAEYGLEVLLLDEQRGCGGQIYRNIERQSDFIANILGKEYQRGCNLVARYKKSSVVHLPESVVWNLVPDGRVSFSRHGVSTELQAKRIVIAIGAMERPAPFSGWTLPGVMGAGGVDALLKSDGLVPAGPVTMVGNGPIMLLVAGHLQKLGVEVAEFLDTTPSSSFLGAVKHLPQAMKRVGYLLTGAAMLASTWKQVGRYQRNVASYSASGKERIETLTTVHGGKKSIRPVSTLLVHEGIIPRTEFSRQLRLDHDWDPVQRYWYPRINADGRTSEKAIFIAGDGAFVHGAVAAELKGELTALALLEDFNKATHETRQRKVQACKALSHELLPRLFVDALYQPRKNLHELDDETIVCRCEEVTAGTIRALIRKGQDTPEKVKATTRSGMGPCQGRMCSCAVSEVVAQETGRDIVSFLPLSVRPPVRNIGLGELANMTLLPKNNETGSDK